MPRVPGKRGRRPARPPGERFPIGYLGAYLSEPLPAPSYPVDVTAGIGDEAWGLLGNGPDPACTVAPEGVGDCGFCAREHNQQAKAAFYGQAGKWETSSQLVEEYLAYDHGQDEGVVLADVLLAWYRAGKIAAFAPVDHTDPAAVDSAMEAFRGVICGVELTDDAEQLFSQGQPWTVAGGEQRDPDDGHVVLKVRADGTSSDDYVTWGCAQKATRGWSAECVIEAWVIITSEDEAAKVDMAALTGDIAALGGTAAPAGAPAAVPPSPPDPAGLLAELAGMVRQVAASADRDIAEVTAWIRSHGL